MKKYVCLLMLSLATVVCYANDYDIDLSKLSPTCGNYTLTESSTRESVMKHCQVLDTHSARVRLFRGTQKIDLKTTNMGNITCKFKMSAVNHDGKLKSCTTTTPPDGQSAIVTTMTKSDSSSSK